MNQRTWVLRSGVYVVLRGGLGAVMSAVGIVLLTRAIGPGAYGVYAAAFGIYIYLVSLSRWGIDVYLIRHEGEPQLQDYHQAFSLLLLLGFIGTGSSFLVLPFLDLWVQIEGFGPVAMAMFAVLPVTLLGLVPLARVERALDYTRLALIELSGQMITYMVALPLAYRGLGPWAPVGGWWASQLFLSGVLYWVSGYRPRLHWEYARVRTILKYGLGYSAAQWVWELRTLVNPLVVGRYAGAEAVGYVALTIRLVEQLSFVKNAAFRPSIAVLARFQRDRARLVSALTEGMQVHILVLGPLLAGFGLVAPWLVPLLFGPAWLPVLDIYPFIALGYLANALFILYSLVLYVLQRNWKVMIFHLVHISLFAGSALWLVPRVGMLGYGWAEVLALVSYGVIYLHVAKEVGRPNYQLVSIWFLAFALAFFWRDLGWVSGLGLVAMVLWPGTWRAVLRYAKALQRQRVPRG
jgi:O-antigen/teichoic acid export membrane protein